jgi:uncharacterized protein (UPF0248 family)
MDKEILNKLRNYYEKNISQVDKEIADIYRSHRGKYASLKSPELVFLKGKKRGLEFAILYIDAQLIKLGETI